jgi:RNA polymerase sigma-70 factor, ECF subfamily
MENIESRIVRELPYLRRYAVVTLRAGDLADDLVQETVLQALDRRALWTHDSNLQGWLCRILRNRYVDHLRWAQRRQHVGMEEASGIGCPPRQVDRLALRDLGAALAALDPALRRTMILAGVQGWTADEVAQRLAIPVATVRTRVFRARRAMQGVLEGARRTSRPRRRSGNC